MRSTDYKYVQDIWRMCNTKWKCTSWPAAIIVQKNVLHLELGNFRDRNLKSEIP